MKKRIIFVLLVFINVILLSSCIERDGMPTSDNIINNTKEKGDITIKDEQRVDERMEQIMSAIINENKEALKSLFSKTILNETINIDNEIDNLFNLVQGDIEFWNSSNFSSERTIKNGKETIMIQFPIRINNDEFEYSIFVIDYTVDTINPENEGLYMLEIYKTEDRDTLDSWQKRMRAGIYIH